MRKAARAQRWAALTAGAVAMTLVAACSSNGGFNGGRAPTTVSGKTKGVSLQLMIGSSGDAETNAVDAAAKAWSRQSGNTVKVIPASNLTQQLTQAMAGGSPPDVFYLSPQQFQEFAKNGSLADVGNKVKNPNDFYPNLRKAFTYKGKFYCAPKDFSTLGIQINTDMWKKAGLTKADYPTTWAKLEADAKKLTTGKVTGLVMSDTLDRVGAFMGEAGGGYTNSKGQFIFDSPQNVKGLDFVQKLAKEGVLKFPKQVGATWGGDALGKGLAAMTVEGNWIVGAMKTDYPKIHYITVPMPAGPTGKRATLSFTNCWGVAANSSSTAAAVDFVNYLTTDAQQVKFANTIGVMPSRQSAKAAFVKDNPDQKAFIDQAAYAIPQVTTPGFATVQAQFDSQIINITRENPKTMLQQLQKNAEALPK